MKQNCTFES